MIKTMIFSASAGKETDTTLFKTTEDNSQVEQIVFKENNK